MNMMGASGLQKCIGLGHNVSSLPLFLATSVSISSLHFLGTGLSYVFVSLLHHGILFWIIVEKIQRLADQCWLQKFDTENETHDYYEFDYEKFAELIVFECAEVAGAHNSPEIGNAILNQFGM